MRGLGMLLLALVVTAGCSSNGSSGAGGGSTATTELSGTYNVSGTGTCTSGCGVVSATYTVKLVSSPCTVTTPVGAFTVGGSVCFTANNNTAAGSISGTNIPTTAKNLGQGLLVGAAADPVPDNSTVNIMFVSAASGGKFYEFTGRERL